MRTNAGDSLKTLRSKGHRITKIRSLLIEVLQRHASPLTVADLLAAIRKLGVEPHKTTLYRELTFLVSESLAVELELGEGKKRYESAAKGHHHHLVCLGCRTIEELELGKHLPRQERKIRQAYNFQVLRHSLEFFGLCQNCR